MKIFSIICSTLFRLANSTRRSPRKRQKKYPSDSTFQRWRDFYLMRELFTAILRRGLIKSLISDEENCWKIFRREKCCREVFVIRQGNVKWGQVRSLIDKILRESEHKLSQSISVIRKTFNEVFINAVYRFLVTIFNDLIIQQFAARAQFLALNFYCAYQWQFQVTKWVINWAFVKSKISFCGSCYEKNIKIFAW